MSKHNENQRNSSSQKESGRILKRDKLQSARRIVVKVGSAILACLESEPFRTLSEQIAWLMQSEKKQVVLVSSGAIALGLKPLGLSSRPKTLPGLQAAAAAGQGLLMAEWQREFEKHRLHVAQILLTHEDMRVRQRYLNAKSALDFLLDQGVVPIINENDTVSVDEIKFGDNDTLAAEVAGLVRADATFLLTQTDGLYTADPRLDPASQRISFLPVVDTSVEAMAGGASHLGTGGMITKIKAARVAQSHGAATVIARGLSPEILKCILRGDDVGTFVPSVEDSPLTARKRWILHTLRPRGTIFVDDGARQALLSHASLLFAGVKEVVGDFRVGDAVAVSHFQDRSVFAKGIVRLDADDIKRIAGLKSDAAAAKLETVLPDELIHRDDLAIC